MDHFELVSEFEPTGDQPEAIRQLVSGFKQGNQFETLLGVTGSGKTFTMANVIQELNKPTLIIAHNKTLAAQLYSEFKAFFPHNAVEYFVSYYDYYQPEAYVPSTDTYIEKDSSVNDEIDKLRHSATAALIERKDVIVVSSVSCIYGIGSKENYSEMMISLRSGIFLRFCLRSASEYILQPKCRTCGNDKGCQFILYRHGRRLPRDLRTVSETGRFSFYHAAIRSRRSCGYDVRFHRSQRNPADHQGWSKQPDCNHRICGFRTRLWARRQLPGSGKSPSGGSADLRRLRDRSRGSGCYRLKCSDTKGKNRQLIIVSGGRSYENYDSH